MNIFSFHKDLCLNAADHPDSYVVKLPLEAAQIASTGLRLMQQSAPSYLYKPTHTGHPLSLWAADSLDNIIAVCQYGLAVADEYSYRYGKIHKSSAVMGKIICQFAPPDYISIDLEGRLLDSPACTNGIVDSDRISSYRQYFVKQKYGKIKCSWKHRKEPPWIKTLLEKSSEFY